MPKAPAAQDPLGFYWYQDYFEGHPLKDIKDPSAVTGDKAKKYCKQCLSVHIAEVQQQYNTAILVGQAPQVPRDQAAIKSYLWTERAAKSVYSRDWRRGAVLTLVNHLAQCPHQNQQVCALALKDASCTIKTTSRRRQKSTSSDDMDTTQLLHQPPHLQTSSQILPARSSTAPDTLQYSTLHSMANWINSVSDSESPAVESTPLSPLILSGNSDPGVSSHIASRPSTPSLAPGDSVSNVSAPPAISGSNIRRRRSRRDLETGSPALPYFNWNSDRQKDFENQIGHLTASAGLPLSWVDNPEFISLIDKLIPAANPPSRKDFQKKAIVAVFQERYTMLQADGWTGENHHHYIAFMITAGGKLYTVKIHDASMERKTAVNLLHVLEEVFQVVQAEWGAAVVAVVTDASGESQKAC